MRGISVFLLCAVALLILVLATGCSTPGQGAKTAPATGTTTLGAQTVGDTQAGQTNVLMGGDVTYNIDTMGRNAELPDEIKMKLADGLDRFRKAIEKAETDDARMRLLEAMTKYADAMGRAFGVAITINVAANSGNGGAADAAGTAGKSAVPAVTKPDLPEVPKVPE